MSSTAEPDSSKQKGRPSAATERIAQAPQFADPAATEGVRKTARATQKERKKGHKLPEVIKDPVEAAKVAGLSYVSDEMSGIRRKRAGKSFSYSMPDGAKVTDAATIARIKSLAIPPAYRDVWVCADENGHIQATGLDDKGRKQYRYHPRWRAVRDESKFARMMQFGAALPRIREAVARDVAKPDFSREKVLAALVQLLEKTAIRVGNEEYARENKHYGLTTMRNRHAKVEGTHVHFEFKGKSGVNHAVDLQDRRLARIIRSLQDLPGQELFQWVDKEGTRHSIGSSEVNAYLKEVSGEEFTAKDFRTWTGTLLAAICLGEMPPELTETNRKKNVVEAVKQVSGHLGNTPTVCRKSYIHPAVLESYLDGSLLEIVQRAKLPSDNGLRDEEAALLHLIETRISQEAKK